MRKLCVVSFVLALAMGSCVKESIDPFEIEPGKGISNNPGENPEDSITGDSASFYAAPIITNNLTPTITNPGITGKISAWHWGSYSKKYGVNFAVEGSPAIATEIIAAYKASNVTRVYGGFARLPGAKPSLMAAWNKRLKAAGIESHLLIGSSSWVYPQNRASMLSEITTQFIGYNQKVEADARFVGLHVDIEPHGLAEWKTASLTRKRELLQMLCDTYRDIKSHLLAKGVTNVQLYADLPVWFDNLSSLGWASTTERDAWFKRCDVYLDGLSMMAYETSSIPTILSRTQWERTNFTGVVEVGLNVTDLGPLWRTKSDFTYAINEVNKQTGKPAVIHAFEDYMVK